MIDFEQLARNMKGDVMTDSLHQMIYATDASAYREIPLAVVYPRDASDVKECIKFARKNGITSGLGREGSKYGIEDYLEIKYMCIGL